MPLQNKLQLPDFPDVSRNKLEAHITNYRHPSLSFIPFYESFGVPRWQVDLKPDTFAPQWQGAMDLGLLREINSKTLAGWIKCNGSQHQRKEFKIRKLRFSGNQLSISWDFNGADFDLHHHYSLPDHFAQSGDVLEMFVRPRDVVFVLSQIAQLNLLGDLVIEAAQRAIRLHFETATAHYDCWIQMMLQTWSLGRSKRQNLKPEFCS